MKLCLQLLLIHLLPPNASAFLGSLGQKTFFALSSTANRLGDEVLKQRLEKYLEKRNTTAAEAVEEAFRPAFDFLKPSGWHKDEVELDFQRRADGRIPKEQFRHPLAYVDLKRYGFEDLIEPIIERGGPVVVGEELLGLNWKPEKEVWDQSLRPTREETWALDMRGSLMLGGALEDKLAAAESLDLERLKQEARLKEELRSQQSIAPESAGEGEDYRSNSRALTKKFKLEKTAKGDRFSLTVPQRAYFLLVSALFAFAYGKSSKDLASQGIVENCRVIFPVVALANLGSSAVCAVEASRREKNAVMWAAKGLLGGPLVLSQMRKASYSVDQISTSHQNIPAE